VLVQALNAPHGAARGATLAVAMAGDRYVVASSAQDVMVQLSQVIGFAIGGAVVALAGKSRGLLLDAATFLVSAVVVCLGVRARPPPGASAGDTAAARMVWSWWGSLTTGLHLVLRNRGLRSLLALACVAGF
jgi:hypothetical protein